MINALISGKHKIDDGAQAPKGKRALNRAKLLRTGAELLSEQSYACTGVDHIIVKTGLTKGTFYHYFKSKEQFVLEVVDLYADYFNQKLDAYLLNDSQPPLERLSAYVGDTIRTMKRDKFTRTCLIGNLSQELGGHDSALVDALKAAF
ncbi:MAG TPA: TetR/AcrR family transcriptional regulator, partial [Orrella sp.]